MADSILLYTLPGFAVMGLAIASCVCIRFLKHRKQTSVPVYPPVQPVYGFQPPYNSMQPHPVYAPQQPTIPMYSPVSPTAPMVSFYGGHTITPAPSAPPIDSTYIPQTHIILNQVEPHQRIYFG
jgi:hypothetical protein